MFLSYQKNNLVNLVNTVVKGCGGKNTYPILDKKLAEEISQAKNVVLLVIDALGADVLQKLSEKSILRHNHIMTLNSVFPPTTAAAITTILTGLTPKEHGVTAWYMNMKEYGSIVALLPYRTKHGEHLVFKKNLKKIAAERSLLDSVSRKKYTVLRKGLLSSPYNHIYKAKNTKFVGYQTLHSMFSHLRNIVKKEKGKKYIYSYWGEFDTCCHDYGKNSKKSMRHLKNIEKELSTFLKKIKGTNTLMLITADHGQMETEEKKVIFLNDHPQLNECLTIPISGEVRSVYCYVRPTKVKQFEDYVRKNLGHCVELHSLGTLIKQGFFGQGKEHPKFRERVGDYVLIAKENYIIKDVLEGRKKDFDIGNHGGISKQEMEIPLIKIKV